MSQAHVDELFSAAYDGALTAEQRRSFDRHLAGCPACTAAFAELSTAVDALHELGPVAMPRPVQLPTGAPGRQRRSAPSWLRLPLSHPWASGLTGAAVAVAAAVTVLITPHLTGLNLSLGNPTTGLSRGSASQGSGASSASVPCAGCALAGPGVPVPAAACFATPVQGAHNGDAVPSDFNNREVQDDGTSTVVIATSVSSYSPGETVDVYARVVDDSNRAVDIPCTYLVPAAEAGTHAAGPDYEAPAAPGTALPSSQIAVDGGPLLQATIPATAAPGETLQIEVEVPAAGGQPAHEVALSIQVS
ncbi:MAG: zf-HC2 domain-containing protein [Candidatus Dormiibacterota bacterium]